MHNGFVPATRAALVRTAAGLAATIVTTLAAVAPAAAPARSAPAAVPAAPAAGAAVTATQVLAAQIAAAVPVRDNGLREPIYWVHGIRFDLKPSFPCAAWAPAISRYRALGATGPQHTVAFYAGDSKCNTRIGSFKTVLSPGIRELGRRLAWEIYNRYTKRGVSVDAVGHSMGGLIVRAAITGVQKRTRGFPPRLYVEDAVTLSTPHTGTWKARVCPGKQCTDMRPGSAFLRWLTANPQSTQGTDWTLIGLIGDNRVNWKDAVSDVKRTGWLSAGHKVVFFGGQGLTHSNITKVGTGHYGSRYWNFYDGRWHVQRAGAPPVVVARNANFFWRLW